MKRSNLPRRLWPAGNDMSGKYTNDRLTKMIDLLDRKKGLMEALINLTTEQSKLLTPEKVAELMATIEKKQECIKEIHLIDAEVLPLEKELLSLSMSKDIQVIDTLRGQIISLAKETQQLENENLGKMKYEHQKLKNEIESLQAKRGTLRAYRRLTRQSDGYFVDKKK